MQVLRLRSAQTAPNYARDDNPGRFVALIPANPIAATAEGGQDPAIGILRKSRGNHQHSPTQGAVAANKGIGYATAMKSLVLICFVLSLSIVGCSVQSSQTPGAPGQPPIAIQDVTGNWEIGAGPSTGNNADLVGSLVSSNGNVSGTLQVRSFTQGSGCPPFSIYAPNLGVVTVTGKVDATNPSAQILNLVSSSFSGIVLTIKLTLPSSLPGNAQGAMQADGPACGFASMSASAALYPSFTGNYTGVLSAGVGANLAPALMNVTLTLTQSTTANADGTFNLTGTFTPDTGTCKTTVPVTNTVSGGYFSEYYGPTFFNALNVIRLDASNAQSLFVTVFGVTCTGGGGQYSGMVTKQ